ncbi:hypothetical protein K435DRAFT_798692 [Dendrothele bispora CBS 962.96]|uniref:Uncharacterized protein n=1 Tax=Dendrothele bispora (strain CBS 962.96) TaxID=1314807 RepID=A0A4S8LZJ6_DENBC|nr:hypothetical protein K435DRAFT_798692 [Dendrothele bispora CBS 962.96]
MDGEAVLKGEAGFSFAPAPSSPSESIPPLTNSTSNSSNSPPQPSTPPTRHSKARSRYPNNLGHVPLHRRGTSQRYEPFEDLLREAGYKETRIFTPESERKTELSNADDGNEDSKSNVRAVGAVMGFLTGLMPGPASKRSTSLRQSYSTSDESQEFTVPSTPTPSRDRAEAATAPPLHSSRRCTQRTADPDQSSTSSLEGLGDNTPRAKHLRDDSHPTSSLPHLQSTTHNAALNLPYLHSNSSFTSPNPHQHRYHYESSINGHSVVSGSSQRQSRAQHRNSSLSSNAPGRHVQKRTSQSTLPPLSQSSSESRQITHTIYHPVPSRASAYLRHMASVPNIPHRPNSTPVHDNHVQRLHQQSRGLFRSHTMDDDEEQLFSPLHRGDGEAEEEIQPPMPKTWLKTVARAVLLGGAGAFVGGPTGSAQSQQRSASNPNARRTPALRQTRSVVSQLQTHQNDDGGNRSYATSLHRSRSGLSDRTNRGPLYMGERLVKSATPVVGRTHAPPELLSKIGRSTTSEVEVRRTRVVCRSAPTSRATSPVKGRSMDKREQKSGSRNITGSDYSTTSVDRGRKIRKELERGPVPSLAKTRVEGDDVWHQKKSGDKRLIGDGSSAYAWNGENVSDSDVSPSASEDDDDDDDDGELDLARMLVPPKRQNSIHSLRKHLISAHNNGVMAPGSSVTSAGSHSVVRRGSSCSSSPYDSGNGRFRRWGAGRRVLERWEDEDVEDSNGTEGHPRIVGADRAEMQRRLLDEHEALERFLNDTDDRQQEVFQPGSSGSRDYQAGTRRGLPSQWVDTA